MLLDAPNCWYVTARNVTRDESKKCGYVSTNNCSIGQRYHIYFTRVLLLYYFEIFIFPSENVSYNFKSDLLRMQRALSWLLGPPHLAFKLSLLRLVS